MKNMKRILVTLVAAVLLMAVSVAGTLAWLTNYTDPVVNTFTYGNVVITLTEGEVWEMVADGENFNAENNGTWKDRENNRTAENIYKLIPGRTYDKDPTVFVDANSEDAYIFVKVENGFSAYEMATTEWGTIATQMADLGWIEVDAANHIFCKTENGKAVVAEAGDELIVFEHFTMSDSLTDEQFTAATQATITVTAYAIQAEGISADDPAAIWTKYVAQTTPTT